MTPEAIALRDHEREDDRRYGEIMGELGVISTKLDELKADVRAIDARQWDEHPSRTGKEPEPSSTRALSSTMGPKMIAGLVLIIATLVQIVDHLIPRH